MSCSLDVCMYVCVCVCVCVCVVALRVKKAFRCNTETPITLPLSHPPFLPFLPCPPSLLSPCPPSLSYRAIQVPKH
jgi:hypothetical protein